MLSDRLCILNVAQEAYKITIGTTVSKLIIIIIQAITLKIYPSFLLFIVVQVCINLIYYIFMNIYIVKTHPWINSGKEELDNEVKRNLLGNIRAMFMHKIGGLIVYNTDNIVISKFIGLGALANFSNYQVIISAFQTVVSTALKGITASIGNLLSTENKGKAYIVHKRIFFLNFWVISFIIITLYNTLNQFIALWVGQKYLIDKGTFIIVLINAYFSSMRGSVEQFQNGSGNFRRDRYAPLFEGVINLVSSIILVKYIGLKGVFIGTLISNITVIFWTKPYVIYKYVFDRSVRDYFIMYFKYLFIGLVPLILTNYITYSIQTIYTFTNFIINCVVNILVINIFYIFIFMKNDNFKYYVNLIKKLIQK